MREIQKMTKEIKKKAEEYAKKVNAMADKKKSASKIASLYLSGRFPQYRSQRVLS